MIRGLLLFALLAITAACGSGSAPADPPVKTNDAAPPKAAAAAPAPAPVPDVARVRLATREGDILLELDGRRAPVTTANFLA